MEKAIRDSLLPAIWGEHSEAFFNPVIVRNQLVTTIERAPTEWSDRLDDLGFKKGSRAWLRLGAVTESELTYLSPSIILKGFRPEDMINAPEIIDTTLVPLSVQDAIAKLWQTNLDAVLFELSFHGVTSKAAAWSHVEAAINGDLTPEAQALTELAFARMHHQGVLDGDGLEYAISQGWQGISQVDAIARGKPVLGTGDSIHWADSAGIIRSGRLACPLRQNDTDVWVYELGPRYVSGICTTTLGRVRRDQVQYLDAVDDWTSELQNAIPESSKANFERLQPGAIDFSVLAPEVMEGVLAVLSKCVYFPEDRWRLDLSTWAASSSNHSGSAQALTVLEGLENLLYDQSKFYYGNIGIGFCLTRAQGASGARPELALRLGTYNTHGFYTITDGVAQQPVSFDSPFDISGRAETIDKQLRARVSEFEQQAKALGSAAGGISSVPMAFYGGHRLTNALSFIADSGLANELSPAQLQVVCAATAGRYGIALDAMNNAAQKPGTSIDIFSKQIPLGSSYESSQLTLTISRNTVSLIPIEEILKHVQASTEHPLEPITADMSFAVMSTRGASGQIEEIATQVSGLSYASGNIVKLVPHAKHEDAANAIRTALNLLSSYALPDQYIQDLLEARERLDSFPLLNRFYRAIEATKNAPFSELRAWVTNELLRSFQGKFSEWSESWQARIIDGACSALRGNQGLVVGLSTRRSFKVAIAGTHEAVNESRDATLGKALVKTKESYNRRAKYALLDAVSFSDPGLCAILAGNRAGLEKKIQTDSGDYQDTGIVSGYARKDIRSFSRDDLLKHAMSMSPEQKDLYLKRELIWPRASLEEMKDKGLHLHTAMAIDVLWKTLPKAPKSLAAEHIRAFTDLVSAMRDGVHRLLAKLDNGEIRDTAPYDTKHTNGALLDAEFRALTHEACFADSVKGVYRYADFKVRGLRGVNIREFSPFTGPLAMREMLDAASWEGVLKSKKATKQYAGSRVVRGDVIRIGDDHRGGVSVNSEDFLRTFGFSGVEYGNWTNQREREKHLNFAYDSMMDFARQLGWEPMALSLGGRLGLCIGSRGRGGPNAAVAHFEPANYAMNLTRLSGDGNLAHEYFHALASHFGHIHTGRSQDLLDTFGYGLQKRGRLPSLNDSELREPVRTAFRNLQVAIMRQPLPGSDDSVIDNYQDLSSMMLRSAEASAYHAEPCEMFARAMESWFSAQLQMQSKRNDYLVRPGMVGGVYPDDEHLQRIASWVAPLLEAIETQVRTVPHPLLGEIEMPVLHSDDRSSCPLTPKDLVELASHELKRLFAKRTPNMLVYSDEIGKPGFYRAALDVIGLNDRYADKETVYHEAWHACEAKLLTTNERRDLNVLFSATSALAGYVVQSMRENDLPELAVNAALESPAEMQAYAFQLWAVGKLDLGEQRLAEFFRVRSFVDDVTSVAALVGGEKAETLFKSFMCGELAARAEQASALDYGRGVSIHIALQEEESLAQETQRSVSGLRLG